MKTRTPNHLISRVYPGSPTAIKLGRAAVGCFCLRVGKIFAAHDTYADALSAAAVGSKPFRWSMDHPKAYPKP